MEIQVNGVYLRTLLLTLLALYLITSLATGLLRSRSQKQKVRLLVYKCLIKRDAR